MKTKDIKYRAATLLAAILIITFASTQLRADTGMCGGAMVTIPFTDVPSSNVFFCAIAEAYFSGLTNGTTLTTYSPSSPVPREQMAAFVTRTLDQSLKRGSRRAALDQWWTQKGRNRGLIHTGVAHPMQLKSDGENLWVAGGDYVSCIRASTGTELDRFGPFTQARAVLIANNYVYVIDDTSPGSLYRIDPNAPRGPSGTSVLLITSSLGGHPVDIAYDGERIWTANFDGSVSIVTLGGSGDTVASMDTITTGFTRPAGITFDGNNIWVTDDGSSTVKKLDSSGFILLARFTDSGPRHPIFDGTNLWVPNRNSNSVTVVRVRDAAGNPLGGPFVLSTLTGNGLSGPEATAFDGERILVTNSSGNSISLWKATNLTPIGSSPVGLDISLGPFSGLYSNPQGACSDGLNFFVALHDSPFSGFGNIVRF
jgi:hypothetical protein